jgi:predicted Zn-dependent peptidase
MALESSSVRAEQLARHLIAHDRLIPSKELVDQVSAVTAAQMKTFAARLRRAAPTVAVAGSGKQSRQQAVRVAAQFQTPVLPLLVKAEA